MKTILVIILLFASYCCKTQSLLIKAGYSYSLISYNKDWYDNEGKLGFCISTAFEIPFKGMIIQPEISFVQRGFRGTYDTHKTDLALYYADLGIPVKYYVGKNNQFYGILGPYIGTGIFGRGNIEYTFKNEEFWVEWHRFRSEDDGIKFMSYIGNRFELGLTGGLGARLFKGLYLDLRYNHGLTNMYKPKSSADSNGDMDAVRKAKNRFLQVSLAMRLNKKKIKG